MVNTSHPTLAKSLMVSITSSSVSPKPTIMPDLGRTLPLFAMISTVFKLVSYLARLRTLGVSRRTVSMLCDTILGPESITWFTSSSTPLKSGINVSMVSSGFFSFTRRTVVAQNAAPPSSRSSLSTLVITQCFNPIFSMVSASRSGSPRSTIPPGLPVFTLQNRHARVHTSPKIIKVAVPLPQHSERLGHLPLTQIVCNPFRAMISFTSRYCFPCGSEILSHSGFRSIKGVFLSIVDFLSTLISAFVSIYFY